MGFQVDQATHKFWLNEVAIWDLRLTEKKGGKKERNKERKKEEKEKKEKKRKQKQENSKVFR
jgi:hypothetical protein